MSPHECRKNTSPKISIIFCFTFFKKAEQESNSSIDAAGVIKKLYLFLQFACTLLTIPSQSCNLHLPLMEETECAVWCVLRAFCTHYSDICGHCTDSGSLLVGWKRFDAGVILSTNTLQTRHYCFWLKITAGALGYLQRCCNKLGSLKRPKDREGGQIHICDITHR